MKIDGFILLSLRKVKRFFLRHDWHRMDKRTPEYHEPCDVVCILYGWHEELGSMYECSLIPNTYYEGFVGPRGLFVSTPKYTYWRHAESFDRQVETKSSMPPAGEPQRGGFMTAFSITWGDPERDRNCKTYKGTVRDTSFFGDE